MPDGRRLPTLVQEMSMRSRRGRSSTTISRLVRLNSVPLTMSVVTLLSRDMGTMTACLLASWSEGDMLENARKPIVCHIFSHQKRRFSNVERPHVRHRPVSQRADEVGDGGARQATGLEVADVVIPQDAQSSGCQLGGVCDPHPGKPWRDSIRKKYMLKQSGQFWPGYQASGK